MSRWSERLGIIVVVALALLIVSQLPATGSDTGPSNPVPLLSVSPQPTSSPIGPSPCVSPIANPGLIFGGHAWSGHEGGDGVPGVQIYRRIGSLEGEVAATTADDGSYRTDFVVIQDKKVIAVWASKPGYTFRPRMYLWHHEANACEDLTLDFVAVPDTYVPLMMKP